MPKTPAITENDKRRVYKAYTDWGPDVDMWSTAFARLTATVKRSVPKANGTTWTLTTQDEIGQWLMDKGWFGPKGDKLRAEGDKFF